jgi:Uma2 family endonuclease
LALSQYDRMVTAGVFDGDENGDVEFIRGEIRAMAPIGPEHEEVVDRLNEWSHASLSKDMVRIRVQNSIGLPALESAPQPDVTWVVRRDYSQGRPTADDVLLLVEVAESTLAYDRGEKADLYAQAGIQDYWIVNLPERTIEVRRDPGPDHYRSLQTYSGDEEIRPLAFPDTVLRPCQLGLA